jgi:probable rRNA maturation factor
MTSSGSTLLFGAIPAELKPVAGEKRELVRFVRLLSAQIGGGRPFVCFLADDAHLERLNRDFLGHAYPTDVLSFPAAAGNLGEIAISSERAAAQAAEFGHSWLEEVKILMLHGMLHLAGFDHEKDGGQMAREEKRWRREFQLPETLIQRAGQRSRAKVRKGAA